MGLRSIILCYKKHVYQRSSSQQHNTPVHIPLLNQMLTMLKTIAALFALLLLRVQAGDEELKAFFNGINFMYNYFESNQGTAYSPCVKETDAQYQIYQLSSINDPHFFPASVLDIEEYGPCRSLMIRCVVEDNKPRLVITDVAGLAAAGTPSTEGEMRVSGGADTLVHLGSQSICGMGQTHAASLATQMTRDDATKLKNAIQALKVKDLKYVKESKQLHTWEYRGKVVVAFSTGSKSKPE